MQALLPLSLRRAAPPLRQLNLRWGRQALRNKLMDLPVCALPHLADFFKHISGEVVFILIG